MARLNKAGEKLIESLAGVLKEIWRTTSGKIALILLLTLVSTSIAAGITITGDFLIRWNTPGYWEDNPVLVPPSWVVNLGYVAAPHQAVYKESPDYVVVTNEGYLMRYTATYDLSVEDIPQDIFIKFKIPIACINNNVVSPLINVIITRPDNISLIAWRASPTVSGVTCEGLRSGGNITYIVWSNDPREMDLASLVTQLTERYEIAIPSDYIGTDPNALSIASVILRNSVRTELTNRYNIVLALFVKPRSISPIAKREAQIPVLKSIMDELVKASDMAKREGDELFASTIYEQAKWVNNSISEISRMTLSDLMGLVSTLSSRIEKASKEALLLGLTNTSRALSDLKTSLDRYYTSISTTNAFLDFSADFQPLTGRYNITVVLLYPGARERPEMWEKGGGKIVIKGKAYGILGTIINGIDLAVVLFYGFPIALLIGLIAAVSSTMIGVIAGVMSGYYGGLIDEVIQRFVDVLANIPFLPLMIIVGTIAQKTLPPGEMKSFYIIMLYVALLIVFSWGGLAITVRAMTLSIKEEPYIEAAKAIGSSNTRIIFKHIFPQVMMYAVAMLVFNVPAAILTEAGLSILGLRHGWPTWGSVLADARNVGRYDMWWWIIPPGLLLSLTSLTFVLLSLAIERIVEPRLRTM